MRANAGEGGLRVEGPAATKDLTALEHQLGTPLPADLRFVLGVFDGGALPNGTLLSARPGPGSTIEAALREVAQRLSRDFLDPELMLPFHRTDHETYLAFDRSAAPVQDTWPVVDYDPDTQDVLLVHRTFDGWCRLCVAEWTSDDWGEDFSIEKYLAQGARHTTIEPDVSIAHVTVAHALRRAGQPEKSLEAYLRAGRCVPAVSWADWEALKLASLLRYPADALEAGARLSLRAPAETWEQRGATPSQVAFAMARVAPPPGEAQAQWLRALDQLVEQALGDDDRAAVAAVRRVLVAGEGPLPTPAPPFAADVAAPDDHDAWWALLCEAYREGTVREQDLLDPQLEPLGRSFDLADVLRIRRGFS